MGYYSTSESEATVLGAFLATPKTHTPFSRVKERGQRFYNPGLGRWLSRDPIGKSRPLDLYVFVSNAASDRFDSLGLLSEDALTEKDEPKKCYGWGAVGCEQSHDGTISWSEKPIEGCGKDCAEKHEAVHTGHFKACCQRAAKCASDGKHTPKECWDIYSAWHSKYTFWSECEAQKAELPCIAKLIKDKGQDCCACVGERQARIQKFLKSCGQLPTEPITACPFDEDGTPTEKKDEPQQPQGQQKPVAY